MIIADHLRSIGFQPKGIVHVGAHAGGEMAEYLTLNPSVIVWVEANPTIFGYLEQHLTPELRKGPPRQIALNSLIGSRDGDVVEFHVFSNFGLSSSVFRATPLLTDTWPDVVETGQVLSLTSSRLDTLLSGEDISSDDVDVLIFDIQGAELMALQGAGEYLKAAKFIEAELSQAAIYDGAPLASEVDTYLVSAGFHRETEIPWHGDAVYRRVGAPT
jgi:FkbM family methyltransferase